MGMEVERNICETIAVGIELEADAKKLRQDDSIQQFRPD